MVLLQYQKNENDIIMKLQSTIRIALVTMIALVSLLGQAQEKAFNWNSANVYFMLTDRFNNADTSNDVQMYRQKKSAVMRGFQGGDIKGITEKLQEGYFNNLGIDAIWFTPVFEQIKGQTDEGTGPTYAYHGYWIRDWTTLDPNFGTEEDLAELVEVAHAKGIRVMMDVVINHIGPNTDLDPMWEDSWAIVDPVCKYSNYENTTACALVPNLPDVITNAGKSVKLPELLKNKWIKEGRYDQEMAELDAYFKRTGYTRTPANYIIKWVTDCVKELGVDAYRVDTVKHLDEAVFKDLKDEAVYSFNTWKKNNPEKVLDNTNFFMLGEVYGYNANNKRIYDFGDKKVDYFNYGFDGLINFQFSHDAKDNSYEGLFAKYNNIIQSPEMKSNGVLNYMASHDDPSCFDKYNVKPYEEANKLLLSPGASQVYYGDESLRTLIVEGAQGDANLRTFMNWDEIYENKYVNGYKVKEVKLYYETLGRFRSKHQAIGLGVHQKIADAPYTFSRVLGEDKVVVALDLPKGEKSISVLGVFPDGTVLREYYTGKIVTVKSGKITYTSDAPVALLELK